MRLGKLRYNSEFIAIKFFYETKNWSINWMCGLYYEKAAWEEAEHAAKFAELLGAACKNV